MTTHHPKRPLVVFGSANMDLVARVGHIPAPGETVLGGELARHHGGKGANQAVAAARLGAAVAFHGAVGRDAFGDELARGLADEGIDIGGLVRVPGASGCALVHVADDGENAISVLPGANRQAPMPPPHWPGATLLMLQLEVPLATNLAWAQAARAAGARVMLNAAPMVPLPLALVQALTLLVVNEHEMALLEAQSDADTRAALSALAWRIVTRGAAGVRALPAAAAAASGQAPLELPGHPVAVVDSTGAGDTFCGALAAGLVGGLPVEAALARANRAAALSCTQAGARGGMPRLEHLL